MQKQIATKHHLDQPGTKFLCNYKNVRNLIYDDVLFPIWIEIMLKNTTERKLHD